MHRARGYGGLVTGDRQHREGSAVRFPYGSSARSGPAVTALAAAAVFAAGALLTRHGGPVQDLDRTVADGLHGVALRHPGLVTALRAVSAVLSPNDFRVLGAVAALAVARSAPRLAVWVVVTLAGQGPLDALLKLVVGRPRPVFPVPVATAAGYAYPSGHAFGSFVGCGVLLAVLLPRLPRGAARAGAVGVAAAVVLLVGWSRVGLGVHWLTDVFAGWVAGAGWLAVMVAVSRSRPFRGRS